MVALAESSGRRRTRTSPLALQEEEEPVHGEPCLKSQHTQLWEQLSFKPAQSQLCSVPGTKGTLILRQPVPQEHSHRPQN